MEEPARIAPEPFPLEALRTVLRWIVEWSLAQPRGAASGELAVKIYPEAAKKKRAEVVPTE
jgi:hypothetical protein